MRNTYIYAYLEVAAELVQEDPKLYLHGSGHGIPRPNLELQVGKYTHAHNKVPGNVQVLNKAWTTPLSASHHPPEM